MLRTARQNFKLFMAHRNWWAFIGVLAVYLLFLLVRYYTSGAFELSDLLLWGACLGSLASAMVQFENDTRQVIKFVTLGLLAVIVNVQLYILTILYQPGAGNGLKMVGFFGLVLAAIVLLCHYDLQKRGRKQLNYTVVGVGFLFFGGLLVTILLYAMQ